MALRNSFDCNTLCGAVLGCMEGCLNSRGKSEFCSKFDTNSESYNQCLYGLEGMREFESRSLTAIYDYHSFGLTAVIGFFALVGVVVLVGVASMCERGRGGNYTGKGQMAKVRFGTELKETPAAPLTMKKSSTPLANGINSKSGGLQAVFGTDELGPVGGDVDDDVDFPPPPKQQFDVEQLKDDMISAIHIVKSKKNAVVEKKVEKPKRNKSKKFRKTGSIVSDKSGPTEFEQEMASENGEPAIEYSGNAMSEELQEALEKFSEVSRKSGISFLSGGEERPSLKTKLKLSKSTSKTKSDLVSEPVTPRSHPPVQARPSSSYLRAVSERERPESIFRPSPEYMMNHVPSGEIPVATGKFKDKVQTTSKASASANLTEII